jgi:hypothetical protein
MKSWVKEWRAIAVASAALFIAGYSVGFGAFLSAYLTTVGDYFSVLLSLLPSIVFLSGVIALAAIGLYFVGSLFSVLANLLKLAIGDERGEGWVTFYGIALYFYVIAGLTTSDSESYSWFFAPISYLRDIAVGLLLDAYERMGGYDNLTPTNFDLTTSALGFKYESAVGLILLIAVAHGAVRVAEHLVAKHKASKIQPAPPVAVTAAQAAADDHGAPVQVQAESDAAPEGGATSVPMPKPRETLPRFLLMIFFALALLGVFFLGELKAKLDINARQYLDLCVSGQHVHTRPILNTERGLVHTPSPGVVDLTPWSKIDQTRYAATSPTCGAAPVNPT